MLGKTNMQRTVGGACAEQLVQVIRWVNLHRKLNFFWFARIHCVLVAPWKLVMVHLKIMVFNRLVACLILLHQWYAEVKECIHATFPAGSAQDTSLHQSEEIHIAWAYLSESS